jgi:hypothetical protein
MISLNIDSHMGCQAENQGVTKRIFTELGRTNPVCPVPGILIGEGTFKINKKINSTSRFRLKSIPVKFQLGRRFQYENYTIGKLRTSAMKKQYS